MNGELDDAASGDEGIGETGCDCMILEVLDKIMSLSTKEFWKKNSFLSLRWLRSEGVVIGGTVQSKFNVDL